MPPKPHDLIAYSHGRIVIGEVLSVSDRSVIVANGNEKVSVPLADILATHPRPDVANLHTTVNKLTAEAQAVHSALTAAGVTGPGTLAEHVSALASELDSVINDRAEIHAILNTATYKTEGPLSDRVRMIVEDANDCRREYGQMVVKYNAMVAENNALREKTAWTIVDMGAVYGLKPSKPETTITVPAGANVRVVVEKP